MNREPHAIPKPRFRLSLFSVFAWLTLVTVVCSHIQVLSRLERAYVEQDRFYGQFGLAIVPDPALVSSAMIRFGNDDRLRVQVYLPQGRRFVLKYATHRPKVFYPPQHWEEVIDLSWVTPDSDRRFHIDFDLTAAEGQGVPTIIVTSATESRSYPIRTAPDHPLAAFPRNGVADLEHEISNGTHIGPPDVPHSILRMFNSQKQGLDVWLDNAPDETQP